MSSRRQVSPDSEGTAADLRVHGHSGNTSTRLGTNCTRRRLGIRPGTVQLTHDLGRLPKREGTTQRIRYFDGHMQLFTQHMYSGFTAHLTRHVQSADTVCVTVSRHYCAVLQEVCPHVAAFSLGQ